jgi:hypothetical protein
MSSIAGDFSLFRNSDRVVGTVCWSEDPSVARLVPSTAQVPKPENITLDVTCPSAA